MNVRQATGGQRQPPHGLHSHDVWWLGFQTRVCVTRACVLRFMWAAKRHDNRFYCRKEQFTPHTCVSYIYIYNNMWLYLYCHTLVCRTIFIYIYTYRLSLYQHATAMALWCYWGEMLTATRPREVIARLHVYAKNVANGQRHTTSHTTVWRAPTPIEIF